MLEQLDNKDYLLCINIYVSFLYCNIKYISANKTYNIKYMYNILTHHKNFTNYFILQEMEMEN